MIKFCIVFTLSHKSQVYLNTFVIVDTTSLSLRVENLYYVLICLKPLLTIIVKFVIDGFSPLFVLSKEGRCDMLL